MRRAITIAFDAQGNPTLLADTRTPISEQERAIQMLKAGRSPAPEEAERVELWIADVTPVWVRPHQPAPAQTTTQETSKPRKEKKSK